MREDLGLLLQLQQWDLETMRLESELNSWAPQRAELVAKVLQGREQAETLKQAWVQLEVARKGQEVPKHILDKMTKKHRNNNGEEE